jgi:predicted dehydrogenase
VNVVRNGAPRVLVLGVGSIGARHAQNLRSLGANVAVADVDAARAAAIQGVDRVAADLGRLDEFDGIVVATPTVMHREHALAALASGAKVLVEKPFAATTEGLDDLLAAARNRVCVGYNLRLHRPVERVRDLICAGAVGQIAMVRVWFGSFLPDWRPSIDYRTTYSARASAGGGVLRDASHEIDFLVWCFGREWTVDGAVLSKRSTLDLDVEDVAIALLHSATGIPALVTLDYVSRRYRRGIEVIGEDATLRLDWATGTLVLEDDAEVHVEDASVPVEESYRREAAAFLDFVSGTSGPSVSAEDGATSVRLCAQIEEAARDSAVSSTALP